MRTARWKAIVALVATAAVACSRTPSSSHVAAPYRGKLHDDTLVEASTTVLVTQRDVVIALDCAPLADALARGDRAAVDGAVAAGTAARLPASVTIYTMPFSPANPASAPLIVTDDKYAGRLCTRNAYAIVKS